MANWKFHSLISEDKPALLEGINIWDYYWHCLDKKIQVLGPFEGQIYYFKAYQIKTGNGTLDFVAGEYSSGQMGLYIKDDYSDRRL